MDSPFIPLPFARCSSESHDKRRQGELYFWISYQGFRSRWSLTPGYYHFGPPDLSFQVAALNQKAGIDRSQNSLELNPPITTRNPHRFHD